MPAKECVRSVLLIFYVKQKQKLKKQKSFNAH